jgi:hypothetical protein
MVLENLRRVVVLRRHDHGKAQKQRERREEIGGGLAVVNREKHVTLDRAGQLDAIPVRAKSSEALVRHLFFCNERSRHLGSAFRIQFQMFALREKLAPGSLGFDWSGIPGDRPAQGTKHLGTTDSLRRYDACREGYGP